MGSFSRRSDRLGLDQKLCYRTVYLLIMLLPINQVTGSMLNDMQKKWAQYKQECVARLEKERNSTTGVYCNGTFDQFVCWPFSAPGIISVPCPWYLPWIGNTTVNTGYVYRHCSDEGVWLRNENSTTIWRDNTECSTNLSKDSQKEKALQTLIRVSYTIGNSISLVSLIIAFFILLIFRKLHCTRNYIHINLFATYTMKALSILMKDMTHYNTYAKKPSDEQEWMTYLKGEDVTACTVFQVLMHFFIGTNHFWLLVEGIYLHTILVTVVLSERGMLLRYFIIGWLFPLLFMVPWVLAKIYFENNVCWNGIENAGIWWIIKGPMILCIIINFIIFLKILKILHSKLKAQQVKSKDYRLRLARATLILIPLLGAHKLLFIIVNDEQFEGRTKQVLQFLELTTGSLEGFLVVMLYCFKNAEVKTELRKQWNLFVLHYIPCQSCFFGNKGKYPTRSSKPPKQKYLAKNGFYQDARHCSNVQLLHVTLNVSKDLDPQTAMSLEYFARGSVSESSDGGLTLGETIEETFEECET
ncbi:glucagon-like peptide 2 receptor isoform X1 [Pelobates fuscus]|uniref:glucagon-like peptide 2 receptor isoform X1 n=1 Tax=Pelobates fuscus TaxID=191477 RepID=UPI002FE486D1